jgi:hypothetical protein
VGYVLDPWQLEGVSGSSAWNPWSIQGQAASRDLKIIPGTERVFMLWEQQGTTQLQRRELSLTTVQDQSQIGMLQFTATPFDNDRQMELRFNPTIPPGPDLVARVIIPSLSGPGSQQQPLQNLNLEFTCEIEVTYQARRNFDPVSGNDDQITASYSTGSAYDVKLAVSQYSPYQQATGALAETPFQAGAQLLMSARVAVQNVGH